MSEQPTERNGRRASTDEDNPARNPRTPSEYSDDQQSAKEPDSSPVTKRGRSTPTEPETPSPKKGRVRSARPRDEHTEDEVEADSGDHHHTPHPFYSGVSGYPVDPRQGPPHPGVVGMYPYPYPYPPGPTMAVHPGMYPFGWPPSMASGYALHREGPRPAWDSSGGPALMGMPMSGGAEGGLAMHARTPSTGSSKDPSSQPSSPDKPRKKTEKACDFCRARKLKCDGDRPFCSTCVLRNPDAPQCAYVAGPPRRRGPAKKNRLVGDPYMRT